LLPLASRADSTKAIGAFAAFAENGEVAPASAARPSPAIAMCLAKAPKGNRFDIMPTTPKRR
jgi:hypothetical protein